MITLSKVLSLASLVLGITLLFAAATLCAYNLYPEYLRRASDVQDERRSIKSKEETPHGGLFSFMKSSHYALAILLLLFFIVPPSMGADYLLSRLLQERFSGDGQTIAVWYGRVFFWGGLSEVLLQLSFGKVLRFGGLLIALLALPLAIAGGVLAFLQTDSLIAAVFTYVGATALRYSLFDPTSRILLLPMPTGLRNRLTAFSSMILKPLLVSLGALALIFLQKSGASLEGIALLILLGLLPLIASMWWVKRLYPRYLTHSLHNKQIHLAQSPPLWTAESLRLLQEELNSPLPHRVIHALGILSQSVEPLRSLEPTFATLCRHPVPTVRLATLETLATLGQPLCLQELPLLFADPLPEIQLAAVTAIARCTPRAERIAALSPALHSPSPFVRAAAAAPLLQEEGTRVRPAAERVLRELLTSTKAIERRAALQALQGLEEAPFPELLPALLEDPDPFVQRQTLALLATQRTPHAVPELLKALCHSPWTQQAATALAHYGAEILPFLARSLTDPEEDLLLRSRIPWVLGRLVSSAAAPSLLEGLSDPEEAISDSCLHALAKLSRQVDNLQLPQGPLLAALEQVKERGLRNLWWRQQLCSIEPQGLAARYLRQQENELLRCLVAGVQALHPHHPLQRIDHALYHRDPKVWACAIDLIEELLPKALAQPFTDFLEALRAPPPYIPSDNYCSGANPEALGELLLEWVREHPDSWGISLACILAAQHNARGLRPLCIVHSESADPLVRESALFALAHWSEGGQDSL